MQYQDGETRSINGVTYVRQGGQWRAQSAGGPVYGSAPPPKTPTPQTPAQASQDQSQAQTAAYTAESKPVYDRLSGIDKIRDGYRQDKRVLNYEAAIPIYADALHSPENAAGDNMLVNAIAKISDPSTGVQQRESQGWENAQPTTDQLKAQLFKQFGTDGYGNFTPEGRRKIRDVISGRMRAIADQYRLTRKEYKDYIKSLNIPNADPETIIGPFAGEPFRQAEGKYLGREPALGMPADANGHVIPDPNYGRPQPIDPTGQGDIGFNQERQGNPLSPEKQALYDAFWKANPNPSEAQLQQFAGSIGLSNWKEILDAKNAGAGVRPGADAVYNPDITDVRKGNEVVDPILRGTADTVTMGLSEELAAIPRALSTGESYDQALAYQNAVRDYDKQNNFGLRIGGQLGGALALPMFGAKTVPQLAGVGGGYGAAYGFGSADGNFGHRAANALLGGATGATLGAAVPIAGSVAKRGLVSVGRRVAGPATAEQKAILQAADQEGVPVNMGDVYPSSQNTLATLETIPGSSGPVRAGIKEGRDAIESRVNDLARGGTAREDMGDAVKNAGKRFVERRGRQAERLYTKARDLADGVHVTPQETMQTLAQLVRQEGSVPGGTKAGAVISRYAKAFEDGGPVTLDGARRMRSELLSSLRQEGGLTRSQANRITGQVMGAMNKDIERSLTAAGRRGAVHAYRQADKFYAETADEIDRVTEKFIGTDASPKSPEQIISTMRNAASPRGGDARALSGMLMRLSPDERKDYAATLVEGLGRKSSEEPFSTSTFVTQIRQLSPQARRIIFGSDGEKSIQNLITLSNAKNASVQRLNNSRSGQVANYRTVLSSIMLGLPGGGAFLGLAQQASVGAGATGAAVGGTIGAAALGGARVVAKALMNEQFTRALANAPATANPKAINAHIGLLRKIAAKDPNVRTVVEGLEKQLFSFANDNARRAGSVAASPNEGPQSDKQGNR